MPRQNKPRLRRNKRKSESWIEYLEDCSTYPEDTGCWVLPGYQDKDGYCKITTEGRTHQAHRFAYMLLVDPELTSDVLLLHSCDNPPCWNPQHLRPGTQADNVADMMSKGRHWKGLMLAAAQN